MALHFWVDLALVVGPWSPRHMAVVRAPMVHLTLIGLRRGDLAGFRWSAINLDGVSIAVAARTRGASQAEPSIRAMARLPPRGDH